MKVCNLEDCKVKVSNLIGYCRHCKLSFCTFHRLPETHKCENLDKMKEQKRLLLLHKLMEERTSKTFF